MCITRLRWMLCAWLLAISFSILGYTDSHAISVKKAVETAIRTNPSKKVEEANFRAVASELEESSNSFGPQVDIFGDLGVQRRLSPTSTSVGGGGGTSTPVNATREIGIRASLLLFDGFERANSVYRNAARLDGATYRLLSASETLALNAVEAYIDVVRHRDLMAAAEHNISRHQKILRQIKERVAGGNAPLSDQIQIEERVFAARAAALDVQNSLENAKDKFHKVIGVQPKGKMKIPSVSGLPNTKGEFVRLSATNNYSVMQTKVAINELQHAREIMRAGHMPRLSLDGRASAGEDRNGTRGDETDLYVGLALSWRIFDGGVINSRGNTAVERIGQAQSQYDVVLRDVKELAGRSWNSYQLGRKRSAVLSAQSKANERIVSSYREEYQLSKRSLLDVLDAERALFSNKFQEISVVASYKFAAYRMLATMSRLTSHFSIAATSLAPKPDFEEQITSDPMGVFNVKIEPLQ